jgi:DNA-binding NtrC family response regulator
VNVLIVGESGTGKELVAQTIHDLSRRARNVFLAVNCGAISPQLIESELFGHEKGSFTGALRQHRGFFERADGGTLFLDEVTEMPLELQVKLLRVLETSSFSRVGSDEVLQSDVRIVAATNRDPADAVAQGKLREDLYYRLNVFQITVAPLRDRLEDIALMAPHFLASLDHAEGVKATFTAAALSQLTHYHWPGNVRELRNIVQRAAIMADGPAINEVPLPDRANAPPLPATRPVEQAATPHTGAPVLTIAVGTPIAVAERALILATLEACGGLREKTAEVLGISLKTLYNRLKQYEVSGSGPEPGSDASASD